MARLRCTNVDNPSKSASIITAPWRCSHHTKTTPMLPHQVARALPAWLLVCTVPHSTSHHSLHMHATKKTLPTSAMDARADSTPVTQASMSLNFSLMHNNDESATSGVHPGARPQTSPIFCCKPATCKKVLCGCGTSLHALCNFLNTQTLFLRPLTHPSALATHACSSPLSTYLCRHV